jgi:hypothetical protein
MKSNAVLDGLSARRRTSQSFKYNPLWVSIIVAALIFSSCHEKTNGQDAKKDKKTSSVKADSLNKPQVNIKVNRRYDDKGNVIGFDSTYSSYYSNIRGDTVQMDSLMGSFDRYFNRNHTSFFNREFSPLFFNDSLRYPDFFHNDFFMKRYELNDQYMRGMMQRMDSIKNQFYEQHSKETKSNEPRRGT